jgi:membrane-bound metal-dependent hydrolase YbcI (DUF457 family)
LAVKGISHFISAVALASFFPEVVERSASGSLVLLMAGLGGILPDMLDFRFARYLRSPDVRISPRADGFDPQAVADQVASAIDQACQADGSLWVQFDTVRIESGIWRKYSVGFPEQDPRSVVVRVENRITTSGASYPADERTGQSSQAAVEQVVGQICGKAICIEAFDGAIIELSRHGDDIHVDFLPWHRRWSHSFVVAACLGGLLVWGLGGWHGLLYAAGSCLHILEDQLGHLGSSLFYPLLRKRFPGLGLVHSGDVLPNLFTVWLSVQVILFNLDRFSPTPTLQAGRYWILGLVLPWAIILSVAGWRRQRRKARTGRSQAWQEVAAETEEVVG